MVRCSRNSQPEVVKKLDIKPEIIALIQDGLRDVTQSRYSVLFLAPSLPLMWPWKTGRRKLFYRYHGYLLPMDHLQIRISLSLSLSSKVVMGHNGKANWEEDFRGAFNIPSPEELEAQEKARAEEAAKAAATQ